MGTAQAVTVMVVQSSGFSVSAATVNAISSAVAATIGNAVGSSTVKGVSEGGVHYTAIGDKFSITLILSPYEISLSNVQYNISLN